MNDIFPFLDQIEKLKDTLRYCQTSMGRTESAAEHSWRLSLMVLVVSKELVLDINIDHAIKIAIVHDLAEAITGDIDAIRVAKGEISKEEKNKMEIEAMQKIKSLLVGKTGEEIFNLWEEYEGAETAEAKFVKALDKLETLTQLVEAGHEFYDYPEFIANYADKAVAKFPALIPLLKQVKQKLKDEFAKGNFAWKPEYDTFC